MLRRSLLVLFGVALPASPQALPPQGPSFPDDHDKDIKLPNGKSQRDEMLKSEFEKSLSDAGDLLRLAGDLKADLEKAGSFVVPVAAIRKTEDIERLCKRIRGRLKRY